MGRVLERNNCELEKEKVVSYEQSTDGYIVQTKAKEFKTKKIIIAQGWNNNLVDAKIKKEQYATKYIVLQEWFENTNKHISTHSVVFDKSITDHYAWVVPKGDKFLVGVGIGRKENRNYKELFTKLKENLTQKGMDLTKPLYLESCMVMRPKNISNVHMGNNGVIIIGESAHLISSSSSEGYSYALKSGRLVAEAINNNSLNLKKIENYFKRNIQKKIIKMHIISNPFLRKLIYWTKFFQI